MTEDNTLTGLEIAVIGMAGRFPAARNIDEYWENIKNGIECIHFFSEEELVNGGISSEIYNRQDFIKSVGGILQGVEYFDAAFFGYSPTEAELLDPQLRLFHECCWEAMEDAGYDPDAYEGLIGLFGGAEDNNEWREKVLLATIDAGTKHTRVLLSSKDFVTARVSYKLNLKGPVYAIITGCSTALASIHLASRSLIGGECDMALAGGVYVHIPYGPGRFYQEGMLESNDGHLRAFDARASGTVFGSGVGIVVLKILEDAITDKNHIYTVIKGSAVNCDGNRKVNFTAPSVKGQVEVIKAAYQIAEVDMETIGYLETHGTGTPLGDPIEINALKQAFNTSPGWRCPIGSVKTNIGHLDVAAGAAGFIKTVLVLKHKLIPPSLNFETPNPKLEMEKSPFYVNTQLKEWESNGSPRRAAVSSFGFGGTNVHAILEEASIAQSALSQGRGGVAPPDPSLEHQLILLSAKTPTALDKMTQNLVEYFKNNLLNYGNHENLVNPGQHPGLLLAETAYTLQVGRQPFPYRRFCVCTTPGEAVQVLPSSPQAEVKEDPPLVFMFSGQGSQYVNMGLEIYQSEPVFREQMDQGIEILKSLTGKEFKDLIYPPADTDAKEAQERIDDPRNSGPIKLLYEYSLGKLLKHWGIRPNAVMGHSFGEYTAACQAGVIALADALELAVLRGELMLRTPPGSMMSVPLPENRINSYLQSHPRVSLAAVNSTDLCFVSGPHQALEDLEKELQGKGVECMRINFPRAAHSHMMKSITGEFANRVRQVKLREPVIPFMSCLTAEWAAPGQLTESGYWAKHLEQPVRFCQAVGKLLDQHHCIFVQVGSDKGLPLFINQHGRLKPGTLATNIARHKKDKPGDMAFLYRQLGMLWQHGVEIDWPGFNAGKQRRRISLPTYPFEGKRYWIDIDLKTVLSRLSPRNRLEKRDKVSDWLYTPSWKRLPLVQKADRNTHETSPALIFCQPGKLGVCLTGKLEEKGRDVIIVKPGEKFQQQEQQVYQINPVEENDYQQLFETLKIQKKIPGLIIHLWNVTGQEVAGMTSALLEKTLDLGLYSLINIVRGMESSKIHQEVQLEVITDNMQQVLGEKFLCPAKATVLGAVGVIPQEYPNISCSTLDIILPEPGSPEQEQLIGQLLDLIGYKSVKGANPVMALRDNHYWTLTYEPPPIEPPREKPQAIPARLRQGGVYLITGGLGGIGLELAQYLVKTVKARLILTGRSPLPDRDQWPHWLDTHPREERVSQRISKVMELEKCGAKVLVYSADSADEKQVQKMLNRAIDHFGQVNGIIHSAGLVDEHGVICSRTREMTENILAPKVRGTMILDRLTREMPLDFFVICSSIASLFPGFGEVGYAAANMFIDAFAHYKNLTSATFTTAINWDTWQEVGAAVEIVKRQKQAGKISYVSLEDAIRPAEGIEAFTLILENPNPQVVVSTKDLHRLLEQRRLPGTREKTEPGENRETPATATKKNLRPRPVLSTPYVPPANPTQQILVEIWQDYFGIDRLGIQDDFFELGGDSLMATIMAARIHKRTNVRIPLTEIFQGPTMELLSQYIKSRQQEEFESIPLVEKKEYYPLAPAQKRLFILQRLEPGLTSYNSPDFFILEGDLDKKRLNQALDRMIQRHESLRTAFQIIEGVPVQQVADQIDSQVEYYTAGEEEAGLIVRDFVRIFDLRSAPLLRVGLIKIRKGRYIYMFDMHHIITDGISLEIFANEFLAMYEGRQLPPLNIQYKDFAQWQIHLLESGVIKKQEEYWLQKFAGEIPIMVLPTDYSRPEAQSFEGRKFQVRLSIGDTQGLNRLSREQDVTLYMTTLAVIEILFSRLSGQETIIMGTITAGRQHEDLQHIIGMFVNTLALKSHPTGDKTFIQYLQELKQKSLAAFENQDYPFEELVSKLNLDRHMNRNPLFDVMFSFQNFEAPPLDARQSPPEAKSNAPLRKKPYPVKDLTSRFDITLFVRENPDFLLFIWEYCTKLFKQETIERYSNYLKKIVSIILENPNIRLGNIEIITAEEKQRVLYDFNNTDAEYPREMTLHELFSLQVEQRPNHVALVGTYQSSITYDELNKRSEQLAGMLKERGVQGDTIAAVILERSPEMIAAILGILKAGAAYMPIDPDYPPDRINYMLADSDSKILVTSPVLSGKFKKFSIVNCQREIACSAQSNSPLERGASSTSLTEFGGGGVCLNLQPEANPSNLAYIIYTSGTTGRPKGVLIEHRHVVRLMFNEKFLFDFDSSDVWTMFHSFCFDFSVWEMYGALLYGGKLVLIPAMTARDPEVYLEILKREKVTIVNQTPSAFYNLVKAELNRPAENLYVKYVIFGGEALSPLRLKEWKNKYPSVKLINMYGITETTVHVTFKELSHDEIKANISNIGIPIPTLSTYVMDKNLKLLPIGVPGELFVGGTGVARGYLNRPQLSREKFPVNPYKPGEILYRSGDLVRLNPEGEMEYLGRIDQQVKIRGFRIELGEIEVQLLKHPAVKETVVIDNKNEDGEKHLYAFIVPGNHDSAPPTGPANLNTAELRDYLLRRLPDYMIPSYFLQIEKIPLTSNGKVHRQALLAAAVVPIQTGRKFVPLGNVVERQIASVWQEVLKCEKIGRNDNFFDRGGNSLNAIHVISKLNEGFKMDIPVLRMFEYPTVGAFSQYLLQQKAAGNILFRQQPEPAVTGMRNLGTDTLRDAKIRRRKQQASRGIKNESD